MAAARETASGGFRGRRPRLRNRSGERRGLPCVFGLAAQAGGGCGGAGRHCSLRSLGACADDGDAGVGGGLGRHRFARRVRGDVAVLGAVASLGACGFGQKRKVGEASSRKTGVRIARRPGSGADYPSYGEGAPAFSKKERHQPFVFDHDASQMRAGGRSAVSISLHGSECDGGRGMMHVHLGKDGKCSEFAAFMVEGQA